MSILARFGGIRSGARPSEIFTTRYPFKSSAGDNQDGCHGIEKNSNQLLPTRRWILYTMIFGILSE
jgi:hypothetical protein